MTKVIDAARGPMAEWDEGADVIDDAAVRGDDTWVLAGLMVPGVTKVMESVRRKQAIVRCAVTALAAERFRQKEGRWPERLAELTPEFLKEAPVDPFDGTLLRIKRVEDGLVIYSVGPDGTDSEGEMDRKDPKREGTDLGFRLWDVGRRGLPSQNPDARK
jgi:hypothetical protein